MADDNPGLLKNLSQNLSLFGEILIVFKALNRLEAVRMSEQFAPDVILMDIEMPVMDGIEATREIKKRIPQQKIMMLTVMDREDRIFDAIRAGATGYLLKDEKPGRILAAIEELMEGGAPMSSVVAIKTLEMLRNQESREEKGGNVESPEDFNLTKRETEILEKIANGLNYNQIADQLYISARTTRKHIENIYEKLHVHSKLEAVKIAQKNKWV